MAPREAFVPSGKSAPDVGKEMENLPLFGQTGDDLSVKLMVSGGVSEGRGEVVGPA